MAINFPDSPTINDTHTANNRTWIWTGTVWNLVGTIGPAGPVNDYVENITGGTGVSVSGTPGTAWTPTVSIGQSVATSSSPTFANITLTGNVTVGGTVDGRDVAADGVKLDALDAAVVLQGSWDASAGSFPGGGSAQAGYTYIVTVAGTVDSVDFNVNDRVLAIVDDASTTTYASNWLKLDYTDQVLSVNSQTGTVVLDADDIDDTSTTNKFVTAADLTTISNALTTSTSFGGDVSGTYDNIIIADDSHNHDGRYYTETESDNLFVNVSGDTMSGNLVFGSHSYYPGIYHSNTASISIRSNGQTSFINSNSDTGLAYYSAFLPSGATISPISTAYNALVVKGVSGQTANLQEWRNSSGTALASMSAAGNFSAATKSFDIEHPTKEGMRLRYGSVEAPEHSVQVRGRCDSEVIVLPDYWRDLVDESTITVQLTPMGRKQSLFVKWFDACEVHVGGSRRKDFFFTVSAERKDVPGLVVEYGDGV